MSTGTKHTYADARARAVAFWKLFPLSSYSRWEFAGSLRRKKPECGDLEHVVIPSYGEVPSSDLFATPQTVNLLWKRMDDLVAEGRLQKHAYGETGFRWGEKYRGVELDGMLNEVFTATPENWGSQYLIRTGPADYSRRVVTAIKEGGMYRQVDGQLILVEDRSLVSVPDERAYLAIAGLPWAEPEDRT